MTRRELEAKWRDRVRRQKRGKLSVREFCRREGVTPTTFYSWRRRLEVEATPIELVELDVGAVPAPIEIVASSGVVVRVSADFDPATLSRVLDVLDARR